MQFFKGDDLEIKMETCGDQIATQLSGQKDAFFTDCYNSFPLGDLIYTIGASPLSNAIIQSVFRESFNDVFNAFSTAGCFESYISVFQKIFGADVDVEFTVPAPGELEIDITATGLEVSDFVARHIVGIDYILDTVITEASDTIEFRTVKGFQTQYELEQMLFELVPSGIYTVITLTLGS